MASAGGTGREEIMRSLLPPDTRAPQTPAKVAAISMDAGKRHSTLIAFAFFISLGSAISVVALLGVQKGVLLGLMLTGRIAFLFFIPAYVSGPLTALFGRMFEPLRKRAREFGLAFAAVILVHLGLVASLYVTGRPPGFDVFVIFGAAAAFTGLLTLLSLPRVRKLLPDHFWPPIRAIATTYILLAFLSDFRHFSFSDKASHLIAYAPFAALAVAGLALKLAAWVKSVNFAALVRPRPQTP